MAQVCETGQLTWGGRPVAGAESNAHSVHMASGEPKKRWEPTGTKTEVRGGFRGPPTGHRGGPGTGRGRGFKSRHPD
jgi:hypothetical protein